MFMVLNDQYHLVNTVTNLLKHIGWFTQTDKNNDESMHE